MILTQSQSSNCRSDEKYFGDRSRRILGRLDVGVREREESG